MVDRAEAMKTAATAFSYGISGEAQPTGKVRLATAENVANELLNERSFSHQSGRWSIKLGRSLCDRQLRANEMDTDSADGSDLADH